MFAAYTLSFFVVVSIYTRRILCMDTANVLSATTVHDDYIPDGSPRSKQRKLDEVVETGRDMSITLTAVTNTLHAHTHEFETLKKIIQSQTEELKSISDQFKLLIGQFSRMESKRLEEIVKMQQEIAQLKKTVHNELVACKETISKEVQKYLTAVDNDRDTLSFEL